VIEQTREQDEDRWVGLTERERSLLKAVLMMADELGDEAALSRLFVSHTAEERALLREFRRNGTYERVAVRLLAQGFNTPPPEATSQTQGPAPGFQDPVGQVSVERCQQKATTDGHGDESRR
jgi:hypothetical protein